MKFKDYSPCVQHAENSPFWFTHPEPLYAQFPICITPIDGTSIWQDRWNSDKKGTSSSAYRFILRCNCKLATLIIRQRPLQTHPQLVLYQEAYSMAKITIKDIAQLVGVSTATISNYLNGNFTKMSEKTRSRIEEIIKNTNYQPSTVAHQLATNEARTIGVSVVDITNPFTSTVLSGIYDACGRAGYSVIFTNAANDNTAELDNINKLRQQDTAGLIIDPIDPDSPIFKILSNDNVVLLDRQSEQPKIDSIVTDNFHAVRNFTTDMIRSGYTDLYFVSWPLDNISTRRLRYQGFQAATGYNDDSHLLIIDRNAPVAFEEQLATIMADSHQKRIGFFSMNAQVLIHLVGTLQNLGYSYPADFGIGTYEDLDWMKIFRPGISSISQNSFKLGEIAVLALIDKLACRREERPVPAPHLIEVPTVFMKRSSY
jgi:LacI family transcriptional regulator, kdg operon repressor